MCDLLVTVVLIHNRVSIIEYNIESAILEEHINPLGIKVFFNANTFFCFDKQIWLLVT